MRYREYDYEVAGITLTRNQAAFIVMGLILAVILATGIVFFYKRVLPYKKDIRLGVKEVVTYTIVDKRYFEHTGQCFLCFDDPNYMHHQVDADTYGSFAIGDAVHVYRGVYSKYVFNKDGKFSFM